MSNSQHQNISLSFLKIHSYVTKSHEYTRIKDKTNNNHNTVLLCSHSNITKSHEYTRIKDKPNNNHNTVLVMFTLKYNQIKKTSNFRKNTNFILNPQAFLITISNLM